MLAGLNGEHDLARGEDAGNRVDAAGEGLAEGDDVGLDVGIVLVREHLARPPEPGLDLVADEENVAFPAGALDALEVV
jgi:hypothetical protein